MLYPILKGQPNIGIMFHIIDDATFVCDLLTDILRSQGFEARAFYSPDAYIKYISSADFEEPEGVFTDINMPYMTGYEMMDVVSIIRPKINFAVMTSDINIRPGYIQHENLYLAKPFRVAEVVRVVNTLLEVEKEGSLHHEVQASSELALPHCA